MRRVTAAAMTGSRTENAATTSTFDLVFKFSLATKYIEMEKMRSSVMMSTTVMAIQRPLTPAQLLSPSDHNRLAVQDVEVKAMATTAHTVDKATAIHEAIVCPCRGDRRWYRNSTAHLESSNVMM